MEELESTYETPTMRGSIDRANRIVGKLRAVADAALDEYPRLKDSWWASEIVAALEDLYPVATGVAQDTDIWTP
jgi:hypothetical protein